MQCLYILLTPESVQYCVGFFSTLPLFHRTVKNRDARTHLTRPDTRHKMRLVCIFLTFENNTGTVPWNKRKVEKNPTPYWTLSGVSKISKHCIKP